MDASCQTVWDIAAKTPILSTFVAAAKAAGLEKMLSDSMLNGTFFVPTDTAFTGAKLSNGMPVAALLDNPPLLAQVLQYHWVVGKALQDIDLRPDVALQTALPKAYLQVIAGPSGKLMIASAYGPPASIITPNIKACKAIIHVIDHVLVPDMAAMMAPAMAPMMSPERGMPMMSMAPAMAPAGIMTAGPTMATMMGP
eukprot:jgi/Botrbrau1/5694/Bobra.0071s0028.1